MSKLPGLSLIAKDIDISNKNVKFINIDNTNSDEPIFIAGTATDTFQLDGKTVKSSNPNQIAHGKFSKLSLINNSLQAVDTSPDVQTGEANYIYVDTETGQLKTNSFIDLFENHIYKYKQLVLTDSSDEDVILTGEELKRLKDLLT